MTHSTEMIALQPNVAAELRLHGVVAWKEEDPWTNQNVSPLDGVPDFERLCPAIPEV